MWYNNKIKTMKNPFVNALLAVLYIAIIALFLFNAPKIESTPSVLAPIVMLSLLTFSVAVMGFLFFFQPLQLYFEDKKKEAIKSFLTTLLTFGLLTLIFAGILFYIQ